MENVNINSTIEELISNEKIANPDLFGMTEDTYSSMMHVSQLAGIMVPGLGIVAPIGLWLYGKDKSESVKQHGLHIFNWMITFYLLLIFVIFLCFLFVGIFILPFLIAVAFIFPIIGAVKASNGKEWVYPLSHDYFKV